MKKILFLCTGNSCRSQMAEGFAKAKLDPEKYTVHSGGLEAHGVNSMAIMVMQEIGIDISGQCSEVVTTQTIETSDMVVTLCDHAEQYCPAVPAEILKLHWSLKDPSKKSGSEDEIVTSFKELRDELALLMEKLPDFLENT